MKDRTYESARTVDDIDYNRRGSLLFAVGVWMVTLASILAAVSVYSYYDLTQHRDVRYVLVEVDNVRGMVRVLDEYRGEMPDSMLERVVDSTLTALVGDLESFDRTTLKRQLTHASYFTKNSVFREFYDQADQRLKSLQKNETIRVVVHNITPIRPGKYTDPTLRQQSLVDYSLITRRGVDREVEVYYTGTLTFRIVPYTQEQLRSTDPEVRERIRANPAGIVVEAFVRSQTTLPPLQTTPTLE